MIEVIGVYKVNEDVHLIEVSVSNKPSEVDVGGFTQEVEGEPRENWQVAYDEQYLNETGDELLVDPPQDNVPFRLIFFLYFVNFDAPLLTPFGKEKLPHPVDLPERLQNVIEFVEVD